MLILVSVLSAFFSLANASNSLVIPAFLEATPYSLEPDVYVLKPEVRAILNILKEKQINPEYLQKFKTLSADKTDWPLPENDQFDLWIHTANAKEDEVSVALQAIKIKVVEESDDFFNDDIYAYFFITDGVVPTGKVTSIYRGLDEGDSLLFNPTDRTIFPLTGGVKAPTQHLIVDYGIVESDGEDIKDLQKLSSIIIDLVAAVYATQEPQTAQVLNLRKEVKALAELLISFANDDRLVTSSFGLTSQEIEQLLTERTFVEFERKHKKNSRLDSWEYKMIFRLLRTE